MDENVDWLEGFVGNFTKSRERKEAFLRAWATGMGWGAACRAAGVAEATPCGWMASDRAFAAARARAEAAIAEGHESTLDQLAAGTLPGSQVQLNAIALRLRGLKPGRYRDSAQRVEVSGALRMEDGNATRAVELLERFAAAARLRAAQAESPAGQAESPAALPEPGGDDGQSE